MEVYWLEEYPFTAAMYARGNDRNHSMYARGNDRNHYIGQISTTARKWTANGSIWQKWPEGVVTLEEMKAYMETLFRMGEL